MSFLTSTTRSDPSFAAREAAANAPGGSICPSSLNVFFCLFYFGFGQLLESDQILKISSFMGAW